MLAFEGTDLPEAIILRSVSGGNTIFGAVVSSRGVGVSWFGSAAFSEFAISAPIFQVFPDAGHVRQIPERENPRALKEARG
jgi:hypothetical protein